MNGATLQSPGRRRDHSTVVPESGAWYDTAIAFVGAALLFSFTLTHFQAAVTDTSARLILEGSVPYRDFWTMYAPGSMYVMAALYAVFGVQMIVGKVAGMLVAAGAVAAFHRLALRLAGRGLALCAAALFAIAFFSSGYHRVLGSFPPAILLILLATLRLAADARAPSMRTLVEAGLLLGLAGVFKHDVAGYACIATGVALLATGRGPKAVAVVAASVLAVMLPVVLALVAAGAGSAAWTALVTYPLGDFRVVRPESFPLIPDIWAGGLRRRAYRGIWWAQLNIPTLALAAGLAGVVMTWRELAPVRRRLMVFVVVAYPLFWSAAHVQANTHKVTLAGLGVLALVAGAPALAGRLRLRAAPWLGVILVAWAGVLIAHHLGTRVVGRSPRVALELPRLAGMTAPESDAAWMRPLAQTLDEVAPPGAPILLLGRRNDVMIHASTQIFWLSDREILGGHHELHPGITDTEPVQRQMLEAIGSAPVAPVVVLEHRFGDEPLDHWGRLYREGGVPVGAQLLDGWVAANYESVGRFGMYEVMRPIRGWEADGSPAGAAAGG